MSQESWVKHSSKHFTCINLGCVHCNRSFDRRGGGGGESEVAGRLGPMQKAFPKGFCSVTTTLTFHL